MSQYQSPSQTFCCDTMRSMWNNIISSEGNSVGFVDRICYPEGAVHNIITFNFCPWCASRVSLIDGVFVISKAFFANCWQCEQDRFLSDDGLCFDCLNNQK